MSISPISSSMMSMYVPSSSLPQKIDYEHQQIIDQLQMYGITSSGDKDTDKMKLETAERMVEMLKSQESSNQRDSIPFDDIMHTLNLTVTGDLDKDYDTTIDELDYEIDMAYTDEEREYFEALKDQVESEYNSSKQNSVSYFNATSQVSLANYMLGI